MDPNEWQMIVRQHTTLVWQTAYRILGNHADASDCFQETFVQAWESSRRQSIRNWAGFLQRLTTARALDLLRRRRRHVSRHGRSHDPDEIASNDIGPLANLQSTELAEQLRLALAELPEQQSQVYCLRHLNHLSYEQIAEELGLSTSAVGVNLHRASERLRAALTPVLGDAANRGES